MPRGGRRKAGDWKIEGSTTENAENMVKIYMRHRIEEFDTEYPEITM
jgi:hypothetical protein